MTGTPAASPVSRSTSSARAPARSRVGSRCVKTLRGIPVRMAPQRVQGQETPTVPVPVPDCRRAWKTGPQTNARVGRGSEPVFNDVETGRPRPQVQAGRHLGARLPQSADSRETQETNQRGRTQTPSNGHHPRCHDTPRPPTPPKPTCPPSWRSSAARIPRAGR